MNEHRSDDATTFGNFGPIIRALAILGAFAALLLMNGCVSTPVGSGGDDPYAYNQITGYPAVGGQRWLGW